MIIWFCQPALIERKVENRQIVTELSECGSSKDVRDATLIPNLSDSQCRRVVKTLRRLIMFVPVVDSNQNPLMPTTPSRAKKWIKSGKATPFWKKGVFCVRLNQEPSARNMQDIAVGVDPGSKEEGFSVKSKAHTYLNIQAQAITWVKKAVKSRSILRRNRRQRKTPYRKNRQNRARGGIPPSTKARWEWKLRILNWLRKMFPITIITVEDIKAWSKKNQRKWNSSFSPLEVGKKWFYQEVKKLGKLIRVKGYQTAEKRKKCGLKKISNKLSTSFYSHCVDSFVLALGAVGGKRKPDNSQVLRIVPLRLRKRSLHDQLFKKGGIRREYKRPFFKKGSLVKHVKLGLAYVGGGTEEKFSLQSLETGKRLTQNAKPGDCKFLTYLSWRFC